MIKKVLLTNNGNQLKLIKSGNRAYIKTKHIYVIIRNNAIFTVRVIEDIKCRRKSYKHACLLTWKTLDYFC